MASLLLGKPLEVCKKNEQGAIIRSQTAGFLKVKSFIKSLWVSYMQVVFDTLSEFQEWTTAKSAMQSAHVVQELLMGIQLLLSGLCNNLLDRAG